MIFEMITRKSKRFFLQKIADATPKTSLIDPDYLEFQGVRSLQTLA